MRVQRTPQGRLVSRADHRFRAIARQLQLRAGICSEHCPRIINCHDRVERKSIGISRNRSRAFFKVVIRERQPATGIHVGQWLIDV